jgi:hypothetical protein
MIYVYGYELPNYSGVQNTLAVPVDTCCIIPVFIQPNWSMESMELDPDVTCNLFTTRDCSDTGFASAHISSGIGMTLPISGTAINAISCSRKREELNGYN